MRSRSVTALPDVLLVTLAASLTALAVAGCPRTATRPTHVLDETGARRELREPWRSPLTLDAVVEGPGACRLRLVGADVPASATRGARLPLTLAFVVEGECAGTRPRVFVHAAAPAAEVNQASADHDPLGGRVDPTEWRRGDLLIDRFELVVPAAIAVDTLVVRAGLYEVTAPVTPQAKSRGSERWRVRPASAHDGSDRVEIGRVHVEGAPPLEASVEVKKRRGPITLDGVLDEPDWQGAARLSFRPYDGRSSIERRTTARLVWDEEHLWVAFEGDDPDVFTPYVKNDDPLYDSEAIEVFIDADGDRDVYVELQAAPANDLHFDAAFAGGRRKNMDRSWDAPYETKTVVTTSGFVSEWKIPVGALEDVPAGEPRAGASWQVNLFRLERVRSGSRVIRTEASAWSPPLSGDFHNLDRFGAVRFVD